MFPASTDGDMTTSAMDGDSAGTMSCDSSKRTLWALCESDGRLGQARWSLTLVEVFRVLVDKCPEPLQLVFQQASHRLDSSLRILRNESSEKVQKPLGDPLGNYAVLSCIAGTVAIPFPSRIQNTIEHFIRIMSSDYQNDVIKIIVMALGHVHPKCIELLFRCLQTADGQIDAKRRLRKPFSSTNAHVSHIYRMVLEDLDITEHSIQTSEALHKHIHRSIVSIVGILTQSEQDFGIEQIELRIHLCVIVRRFVEEYYSPSKGSPLENSIRQRLFDVLYPWGGCGPLHKDKLETIM
eukprot:54360_1